MRDSVSQLAGLLGQIAEVLQPFVTSHRAGDLTWNGQEYAPAAAACEADSVATAWWATASTAAALLAGEDSLSRQQMSTCRAVSSAAWAAFRALLSIPRAGAAKLQKQIVSWRSFARRYTLASRHSLRANLKRPNQAMQPTAGRRTAKLSMTPTSSPVATCALASGG